MLIAVLITILLKSLLLNRIHEIFPGAYNIGVVVDGLLVSLVASYAFYLVVVHYKLISDQLLIFPKVEQWAKEIIRDCNSQLRDMSTESNITLELESLERENVRSAFKKIHPTGQAPLLLPVLEVTHANWLQYLVYGKQKTKSLSSKIYTQLLFLDAKLVSLVSEIDDCKYFTQLEMVLSVPISNDDIAFLHSNFYDYCDACKELEQYLNAHPIMADISLGARCS